MPVLINNQSQLAEDLSQEQADQALQGGSHSIPLNDPNGDPIGASLGDAHGLLSQGHTQPSAEQLADMLSYAKHSSGLEQAKTFAEGAGEAATFGLSSALEKAGGVDPKDVLGRRDTNPGMHMAGQLTGLGATSLAGVGEGALLGQAGDVAAAASGFGTEGAGLLSRAAATSVKQMAEMAMLQGGDEASKMFLQDPNQSMETALVDIGIAGAMGSVLGGVGHAAVEPLWNALGGSKLAKILTGLKDKAVGVESADIASEAADRAGLSLSPSLKGAISGDATAKGFGQDLIDSGSKAGAAFRQERDDVIKASTGEALGALGRTPEALEKIGDVSDYQSGSNVRTALNDELKSKYGPVAEKYQQIEDRFSKQALPETAHNALAEDLGQLSIKEGFTKSPSAPELGVINTLIKELPLQTSINDLRKYGSIAYGKAAATENYHFASQVRNIFRDATEKALTDTVGSEAPELMATLKEVAQGYKANAELTDALNDRLHVGKYGGPQGFLKNLSEMSPEQLLNRITKSNDAGLLQLLQEQLPQTANAVRNEHINSIVYKASSAADPTRAIMKQVAGMSPELKAFSLPQGAEAKLDAIKGVLESLPKREGFSNTPRVLDKMWKHMPGGAGAMISMVLGHNPLVGAALGEISQLIGREAPDAGKMAFLKFLGSEAPINAGGYKAMYETSSSLLKATNKLNKAAKAIFKSGAEVVPDSMIPSEKQKNVIDKAVKAAQLDPSKFQDLGGNVGHYLPDHAASLGMVVGRATTYLASLTPDTSKLGPVDGNRVPTAAEKSKYNRAVSLVAQPLQLLSHLKNGTLLPEDITTISSVYPSLYQHMQAQVMDAMTSHTSNEGTVPIRSQAGLSMLLGGPVSASLAPQSIAMNQATFSPPPGPPQAPGANKTKAMTKMASMESTPEQARAKKKVS